MRYTKLPYDLLDEIQIGAGLLVSSFTPATGVIGTILGATSGGVTFKAAPTLADFGDDIDNCPKNTKELASYERWDVALSGDFAAVSAAASARLIGGADTSATGDVTKFTPRELRGTDFQELWFVGNFSSKTGALNGGFIAIHVKNSLSTGGFSLKTTDKLKGKFGFEFKGFTSILYPDDLAPFEIFMRVGGDEESSYSYAMSVIAAAITGDTTHTRLTFSPAPDNSATYGYYAITTYPMALPAAGDVIAIGTSARNFTANTSAMLGGTCDIACSNGEYITLAICTRQNVGGVNHYTVVSAGQVQAVVGS